MFRNTLFAKLFFLLIVVGALLVPGTYYFTIPMVDQRVYEIEEHSGRTTLDNIFTLLIQSEKDLADWESNALEIHKKNLKDIVHIASTCLDRIKEKYTRGLISLDEARKEAVAEISCFRYSSNDYLYISDYSGNIIYHPDPRQNGTNASELRDIYGKLVVTPMIEQARTNGDVFYDYWWKRLGNNEPSHKLTYTKNLQSWGWVIGSGVYLDDIKRETAARRGETISFLRDYLRSTKIAANGYMYIFDGDLNMIIHPNANIEGTNFSTLKNPVSGKLIGQELMAVASSSNNKFVYKWDKPSDPGHYVYDKVAWVRYLPEYDYYVASSVYMDDLLSSGKQLATRLFQVAVFTIIFLTVCGLALIYNVTHALKKLAMAANRIVSGDLSGKADIRRKDEIGQLGHSFNRMVDKLKEQIDNLEAGVEERTTTLSLLVKRLERNNIETNMLKEANEMLQACRNDNEVYQTVRLVMQKAFPGVYGALFSLIYDGQRLEVVADWNYEKCDTGSVYDHDSCFALRRGTTYFLEDSDRQLPCPHVNSTVLSSSVCIPVAAYGETFGILHMEHPYVEDKDQSIRMINLIENIAEYTANTLANLRLRSRLQQQSIRDPLTDLFNRRYMGEALRQEESRARRNDSQVAVIMLDVDHFKHFNDNYGHEAGDEILQILGQLLRNHFRDSDIPCRYGGEEFAIILPEISLDQCMVKAEQLRIETQKKVIIYRQGKDIGVTLSAGIALFPLHGETLTLVLKRADEALYKAKEKGRDMVVSADLLL